MEEMGEGRVRVGYGRPKVGMAKGYMAHPSGFGSGDVGRLRGVRRVGRIEEDVVEGGEGGEGGEGKDGKDGKEGGEGGEGGGEREREGAIAREMGSVATCAPYDPQGRVWASLRKRGINAQPLSVLAGVQGVGEGEGVSSGGGVTYVGQESVSFPFPADRMDSVALSPISFELPRVVIPLRDVDRSCRRSTLWDVPKDLKAGMAAAREAKEEAAGGGGGGGRDRPSKRRGYGGEDGRSTPSRVGGARGKHRK